MTGPSSIEVATKETAERVVKAALEAGIKAKEDAAAREAAAKEVSLALETARSWAAAAAAVFKEERAAVATLEYATTKDDGPPLPPPAHDDQDDEEDHTAYMEANTIANLHAQASSVQNIRAMVPIVLDPLSTQYTKWHGHMILTLQRYSLDDHVLEDTAYPNMLAWLCMDCVIVSWLFNTISPDLMEVIDDRHDITDCMVWLGIEHQFLDNH